jgi:hypothetical protein
MLDLNSHQQHNQRAALIELISKATKAKALQAGAR